jgi:hypothetical protein
VVKAPNSKNEIKDDGRVVGGVPEEGIGPKRALRVLPIFKKWDFRRAIVDGRARKSPFLSAVFAQPPSLKVFSCFLSFFLKKSRFY